MAGRESSLLSPIISGLFVLRRVALCNSPEIPLRLQRGAGQQVVNKVVAAAGAGAGHEMNIRRVNKRFLADLSRTFSMAPALVGDREAAKAAKARPSRTADNDAG